MRIPQRVCVFGGTFDPVHKAHLRIAGEAQAQCHLDRILFVPAGRPPHKEFEAITPFEDRFRMVEAACAAFPCFEASRLEQAPRSSYSIDTIETLKQELRNEAKLFFLIGSDAFDEIESWKRWRDLTSLVTFIVAARPGSQYKVPPHASVERMDSLALGISSSDIRHRLAAGEDTPELPDAVCEYIRKHGLYGWPTNANSPGMNAIELD